METASVPSESTLHNAVGDFKPQLITDGQTSFNRTGQLSNRRADTLALAFGLTLSNALADGDKLSFAMARHLAVSGWQVMLRSGTGISLAVANQRTALILPRPQFR